MGGWQNIAFLAIKHGPTMRLPCGSGDGVVVGLKHGRRGYRERFEFRRLGQGSKVHTQLFFMHGSVELMRCKTLS